MKTNTFARRAEAILKPCSKAGPCGRVLFALALLAAVSGRAGLTYVGNPLGVSESGSDHDYLAPLVIMGEYAPGGPLPSAQNNLTLPQGAVRDVRFYGQNYNFVLFAYKWISTDSGDNTQTFQVIAYQRLSGVNDAPGMITNSVSNFCVPDGALLGWAGIGPFYPQSPWDELYSDATYEDADNAGTYVATPPLLGQTIGMGLNEVSPADARYGYIFDGLFGNQGRVYAIGVDVDTTAQCTNCINIENPLPITVGTCGNSAIVNFMDQIGWYDPCCTNSSVSCNPPSGSPFPIGTTTVTTTVTDTCGHSYSQDFTVTVNPVASDPILNCPEGPIELNGPSPALLPDLTTLPGLTDGNAAPVTVTQDTPPGTLIYGPTDVTLTATDACGDSVSCTVTVQILPTLPSGILNIGPGPADTNGVASLAISWTVPNAQLQQSTNLFDWYSIPGATNSPYYANPCGQAGFYRLMISSGTNY